jgi:hypothetical protein
MIDFEQQRASKSRGGDAEPWPPSWMLDLERAHDRLGRAAHLLETGARSGPVDLRPAARAIEQVYGALFDAFDERRSLVEATREAVAAASDASSLLQPAAADPSVGFALEYLREVHASLSSAYERVAYLIPRTLPKAPEIRASFEEPVLHALDRSSLTPHLRVPPPTPPDVQGVPPAIERPKTFEDLDRITRQLKEAALAPKPPRTRRAKPTPAVEPEPTPGFARDIPRARTQGEFVRERVRSCFEEITMIGVQRAPLLGDPWRTARILERRMLASIDAIVAMGAPALDALESMVMDAPLKDPSRVFAIAMTLGSLTGRDALAMVERVFAAVELDGPEHGAQLGAALKLVHHPLLAVSLRTFLGDADPTRRALAIDVLAYRGMATSDELARATADEPEVVAAVLPWLALTRHAALRNAIDSALEESFARVRIAARLAMVLGSDMRAVGALRQALDATPEESDAAASLLGIVCGPSEADLLIARAQAAPSRASVAAVGWTGSVAAIAPLMALLRHDDEAVMLAAAYALDRITNAGLHEEVVVEADEIMAPDIPEPDLGDGKPPLARIVSDPRDLPAQPSTDKLMRPSTDVERWKAWWLEKREAFDPKARWRRGHPYTPLVSWRELDLWPCTPGERRLLHTELVARTGEYSRFDILDFVPVQEKAVAAWQEIARRASGSAGSWNLPGRRSP